VFPDHWSFLLGEIALYSFVVLVASGVFLALFFEPSSAPTTYTGAYAPLHGEQVTRAFDSAMRLSFDVPAGLLVRQTHHWAALVFLVAIVLHLLRIFFTGAFRKPRDVNYFIGVTMLAVAVFEGFAGYSLPDDLLSGMGLAIAYGVAMSIPILGGNAAFLAWGAQFPGSEAFEPRLFIAHVLIVPVLLATLIAIHLAVIVRQKHSQFPGEGRTERNVVGTPMWPGYALRSLGLLMSVAAVLVLLGGLVQINPIWQWGHYEPWQATNGAQPDWYLGWLIGALRLVPSFDVTIGDYTLVPNPFWGGALFPLVVLLVLAFWPAAERRLTGDHAHHNLLDRPRDAPGRTAAGAAFLTWVFLIFVSGSADRVYVFLGLSYNAQIWFYRVAVWVLPAIVFVVVRRWCLALQAAEALEHDRERAVQEAHAEGVT
jgi:ubiquinol-cytochrome c reductase cytochrome b subunit